MSAASQRTLSEVHGRTQLGIARDALLPGPVLARERARRPAAAPPAPAAKRAAPARRAAQRSAVSARADRLGEQHARRLRGSRRRSRRRPAPACRRPSPPAPRAESLRRRSAARAGRRPGRARRRSLGRGLRTTLTFARPQRAGSSGPQPANSQRACGKRCGELAQHRQPFLLDEAAEEEQQRRAGRHAEPAAQLPPLVRADGWKTLGVHAVLHQQRRAAKAHEAAEIRAHRFALEHHLVRAAQHPGAQHAVRRARAAARSSGLRYGTCPTCCVTSTGRRARRAAAKATRFGRYRQSCRCTTSASRQARDQASQRAPGDQTG